MTIEVVKRGKKPSETVLTGTCTTCKTEVRGPRKDWIVSPDQRDYGHFTTCPECYGSIWANEPGPGPHETR